LEYRDFHKDPTRSCRRSQSSTPLKARNRRHAQRRHGQLGVTLGRQRLASLPCTTTRSSQNSCLPRLDTPTKQIDLARNGYPSATAEHGVPRFNEFRRQYGLRQLTSYDDFIDHHLDPASDAYKQQQQIVTELRQVYGTHTCDASKSSRRSGQRRQPAPSTTASPPQRLRHRQH